MEALNSNNWRKTENHLDHLEARWFAVYTRSKCEKKALAGLIKKGIRAYVPLLKYTRIYGRKKRNVELPLISSYVFVKITKDQYVKVIEMSEILCFVRFSNNLISIPDHEIQLLQKIVGEAQNLRFDSENLVPGSPVEIIAGALTGLKGVLVSEMNKNEFIVELEHIGINLRMSVPLKNLRKTGI